MITSLMVMPCALPFLWHHVAKAQPLVEKQIGRRHICAVEDCVLNFITVVLSLDIWLKTGIPWIF